MPKRDIIVVGGSAGSLHPVHELVERLPAGFPAAVLVTVHLAPDRVSEVAGILHRAGALPAAQAHDGEAIVAGRIYLAPPDHHLIVRPGRIELSRAPREDHARPAVDALFRSAAASYGPRVIGVLLSGMLGDGTTGLMAVKLHGGVALVQDPQQAVQPSMPQRAIDRVAVDRVFTSDTLPRILVEMVGEELGVPAARPTDAAPEGVVARDLQAQAAGGNAGRITPLTCPDCGGALWQLGSETDPHFRCHVGHAYSADMLRIEQSEALETALWSAVRRLVERAIVLRQNANRARLAGEARRAAELEAQAGRDEQHMELIRDKLLRPMPALYEEGELAMAPRKTDERPGVGAFTR